MDSDAEGVPSEFFDYFKVIYCQRCILYLDIFLYFFALTLSFSCLQVLCIQGFLTCRKHAERIILLVEMLQVDPDYTVPIANFICLICNTFVSHV